MKDEIKELLEHIEILDNTDYILHSDKAKLLLDYITNLQQENERLKAQLTDTEWEYQNTRRKYEKQYKKGITEELIEDIEECFFNRENPSMIPIDSLDVCHIFGYIDYLRDYKSRVEKAIEQAKEKIKGYKETIDMLITTSVENKRYEIAELRYRIREQEDLLNILQNGSESK